jgi:hypothetical protein
MGVLRCHVLVLALAASAAGAQPTPAPAGRTVEAVAREVIETSGGGRLGMQMMQQMLPALKQMLPDVPDSFWTSFMDEVRLDDLVDRTVPIYAKHFSKDDLEALLAFYRSPAGQRVLSEMPAVLQECMAAGQEWGKELAKRAVEKAQELEEDDSD